MYQAPNLFVLLSESCLQGLKCTSDDLVIIHAGGSVCCWAIPLSGLAPHPTPGIPAAWLGPAFQHSSIPALPGNCHPSMKSDLSIHAPFQSMNS